MRRWTGFVVLALAIAMITSFTALAQQSGGSGSHEKLEATPATVQKGMIVTPDSSVERSEDAGVRAHTNVVVRSLDGKKPLLLNSAVAQSAIGPDTTTTIETPESLGCLYVNSPKKIGCIPDFYAGGGGGPSKGGWGAIALVDAYDNPYASQDLVEFDKYFKLTAAKFTKIYANGNGDCKTPPVNAGWSLESSLDIEWAHVYAPQAQIILVEACSNSYTDLLYAEGVAIDYIISNFPGGEVSNSWGSAEFSGENSDDPLFAGWNYDYFVPIVTFASAGDSGCGAAYPSSNPWLISAGGTTVNRNSDFTFANESCWSGSGGGNSVYETYATGFTGSNTGPWANYQYEIFGEATRQTPDFAHDADPASGVAVDSLEYGIAAGACTAEPCFWQVGGTSVASPSLASIVNRSDNRLGTWFQNDVNNYGYFTNEEDTLLYSQLPTATSYYVNFYDITTGSNGCTVTDHWDYCTGLGSPRGLLGK